ncbi:lupus la ribonucleoprotein [Echinococcus multilocularis]|uniref:Lupus la ribonucleoprotein n=1 Tax=Echinococcus multilocularis TaxID=6211 RepID=A0A0S4MIK5_ECHMU|nr:lupus la ribonucleoprotein [Echinococcus multilocularis]
MQAAGDSDGLGHGPRGSLAGSADSGVDRQSEDVSSTLAPKIMQSVNKPALDRPDGSLESRILRQIEFYFSDANILKDQFLLKSVKTNKEGWVKLSTIAGFRRVQSLTKDEDTIWRALKNSTQSMNLNVKLVRIIDPGKTIPPDLIKSASLIGFLGKERCAVVEFDSRESALRALGVTKSAWPYSYCTSLLERRLKSSEPLKSRENLKKYAVSRPDLSARPQILLASGVYSNVKVELIRDPRAPPNENSVGFEPNWRETLRLQRLSMADHNDDSSHSNSVSSDEFFTPQAPSPRTQINPSTVLPASSPAQPASQLMLLDEAIISVIPTVGGGSG